MVAAVVLPYFSMLRTTFSGASPSFSDAESDDALIGLVTHQQVHVAGRETVLRQQPPADLLGLAHREPEDRLAVLVHVVQPLLDGLVGRGQPAPAGGHLQRRSPAAVDLVRVVEDPDGGVVRRREHGHPGAVAEQHARRPVGVVDDARHDVGPDRQHVAMRPEGHLLGSHRQREGEAGAGRAEIEAPGVGRPDLVLEHARGRREDRVGRRRAHDDEADVGRGDARAPDRFPRGLGGGIRRCDAAVDDVPLADAGALHDPLVGGRHHLLEVRVRQHARGHVGGEGRDPDAPQGLPRREPVAIAGRLLGSVHHSRGSFLGDVRPKYS